MDFNRVLSVLTMAGLAGLVILNYQGASTLFSTLGSQATHYVSTVQGRSQ